VVTPDHPDLGSYDPDPEYKASLLDLAAQSLAEYFKGSIITDYVE